jgi:Zn-finger nucleic acid-binding protein
VTKHIPSMSCPRCGDAIAAVDTDEGVTLDFCRGCSGVWLDAGELSTFMSWKTEPTRQEQSSDLTACPRCSSPTLAGFSYADGPLLNGCTACGGVWCDSGEVAALKRLSPGARTTLIDGAEVPLLATEGASGVVIDWKWVVIGAGLMVAMLGLSSIVITLWLASDAVMGGTRPLGADTLMLVGGALSFAISGFLVGWRSSAYTLWEPALIAIPSAMVFPLFFVQHVTTTELLLVSLGAFVVTMLSAVAGERFGD